MREWQERQEARRKEGTAGQWESLAPSTSTATRSQEVEAMPSFSLPRETSSYIVREKQGQFQREDDDDIGAAEIKVKKRLKVNGDAEKARQTEEESKKMLPSWTPLRLDTGVGVKKEGVQGVPMEVRATQQVDLSEDDVKSEAKEQTAAPQETPSQALEESTSTSLFKKRKTGAGAGAKRVRAVI